MPRIPLASRLGALAACLMLTTHVCLTVSCAAPDAPRFASLGSHRVAYTVAGADANVPTLVFVHGWAGSGAFWREQVPVLARHARLVLVDLPGHGRSDAPRVDYTMDFLARGVLAVMDDAKVAKATLIGHSMGAAVICRVYAQAPARAAALVSVDGMLRRPPLTAEQIERFVGPYHTAGYREHATQFIGAMFPNPGTEALRDRVCADVLTTPQHVMAGAMDGMFQPSQPDWNPGHVDVPVLVINAASPHWTGDHEVFARALSTRTDYRTITGPGHFLMLERPAEFNSALVDALRRFDLVGR